MANVSLRSAGNKLLNAGNGNNTHMRIQEEVVTTETVHFYAHVIVSNTLNSDHRFVCFKRSVIN